MLGGRPRGNPRLRRSQGPRKAAPARTRRPTERGLGGDQVEGRRAVRELLAAKRRKTREVWLAEDLDASPLIAEIGDMAATARVPVRRVSRGRLDGAARTDAPQGVIARADPLPETDLEALCRPSRAGAPAFLVVFDGVTDPHNLGAVLRSAEAAGATGAVLPRHRATHVTPTVAKAAAGAVEYVPMAVVPGIPAALAALRDHGVWTIGMAEDGDRSVYDLDLASEPVAIVLGAEGSGLSRLTRQRCDVTAAIPLHGHIASLNVAAAGAIACFEIARRRAI